jgi:hypothetical protein
MVVTLVPRGERYIHSQSYVFTTFYHYFLISFLVAYFHNHIFSQLFITICSYHFWLFIVQILHVQGRLLTRFNLTNVQDEGLRIGGIGRRMNSKVKINQTKRISRINVEVNLVYSQYVPNRPLLAPIYRWPGLKEPIGSDTYYNVCIRH